MPCYSPLKGFKDEENGAWTGKRSNTAREPMEVACGSCLGCRLDRSLMWAMRLVHEGKLHEYNRGNSFVTLTYRDRIECTEEELKNGYHVPDDWSLNKKHFQLFMKRLRKHFGGNIRFFHCGEYGNTCKHGLDLEMVGCPMCNLGRPHYHAILFNVSFDDIEKYGVAHDGEPRWTSPTLEKIWKYGFVDVGSLNYQSAAYVARYILKKVSGVKAQDHYYSTDLYGEVTFLEPEYCTMSRRPGIGKEWFDKYWKDVFPSDEVPVAGKGVLKGVPRYYNDLFKLQDPDTMEEIKEKRQRYKEEHPEEFDSRRLESKYKVKKRAIETLKRSL